MIDLPRALLPSSSRAALVEDDLERCDRVLDARADDVQPHIRDPGFGRSDLLEAVAIGVSHDCPFRLGERRVVLYEVQVRRHLYGDVRVWHRDLRNRRIDRRCRLFVAGYKNEQENSDGAAEHQHLAHMVFSSRRCCLHYAL